MSERCPRCDRPFAVGTATAGLWRALREDGTVAIEFYDAKRGVYRRAIAEIDGETYKPGVAYVVRDGVLIPSTSVREREGSDVA